MGKRKKNRAQVTVHLPASSESILHTEATVGAETFDEPITAARYFNDATSATNIEEEETKESYAGSYAALIDKHLFSGKRQLPVSQIAFILLAIAIGWIFIQDNSKGLFDQNNWSAIFWTFKKCLVLACVFFILFLIQFILNKTILWFKNR